MKDIQRLIANGSLFRVCKSSAGRLNVCKYEFPFIPNNWTDLDFNAIKDVDQTKSASLIIDDNLSWCKHIDAKNSFAIVALKRI